MVVDSDGNFDHGRHHGYDASSGILLLAMRANSHNQVREL